MSAVRTTCPYCGVGCGLIVQLSDGRVHVRGDPAHPANRGALCSKGSALGETTALQGRLLQPRLRGQNSDWPTALAAVAEGFSRIIAEHGPDAIAFYVSGQLLTEDYYVANKLCKGFIGTGNIDTNSRLCMSSAVAAHRRAFGEDLVPTTYEDVELADLLLIVGSNLAWCHPVLYQRIAAARRRRPQMRIIVIDPRRTPTCDLADLHLPLRAGTDVMFFNGLLSWLARQGLLDRQFLQEHTRGLSRALLAADNTAGDLESVALSCGVSAEALRQAFDWFGGTARVVSLFSQGVNQSSSGTDKANSIINVHLAAGRIGQPGAGPFSITGQPNAMGGREVGGFANALAAHMQIDNEAHRQIVQQFWQAPRLPQRAGLKTVEMFEAIYHGRIKAVWIMATNPVVSLPNADRAREALRRCELVVVSECVARTDTAAFAHVLLPASAWGEKQGTVTNSDRHISRQRAFLPAAGAARPDWWIICQVAQRLGFRSQFDYTGPSEIFDEHARLTATCNEGSRALDLGALVGMAPETYEQLEPIQWPLPRGAETGTRRLFGDRRFYHPDRRARLVALRPRAPRYLVDEEYPFVLNTGRIRDQWHGMTRSGLSPRLCMHLPEPFVDVHAADMQRLGLKAQSLVRVVTRWGQFVGRLRSSGEAGRGTLFVPIHWSDLNASQARVGALVGPAVDPLSGEPEFKHTPARLEPFVVNWYGVSFSRHPLALQQLAWWTCVEGGAFRRYEMAGRGVPGNWSSWARSLLGAETGADWIDYQDAAQGTYRAAHLRGGCLESCLFVSPTVQLPSRSWLATLFESSALSAAERQSLLAAEPIDPAADVGATVCACLGVGRRSIEAAIARGCTDLAALGQQLGAGTQCGSCVPELRRLIHAAATAA